MESLGVRKGAWSREEVLLRKCVEKYGEGKWNLVPAPRAAVDTLDTQVSASSKPSSTSQQPNDDIIWWESLLDGHAQRDQETDFSTRCSGEMLISSLWTEETATETTGTTDCMVEQIQGGEGDFPVSDTPNTQAKDLM
ncbi:hypothetical protein AAG906_041138 [Vitis piasezkii]